MNALYPVFTTETECQDCYKCLRSCPVKAIKIEKARAAVMPEMCVACGRCVGVCPAGAKKIRRDRVRVESLLKGGRPVYLSLAPSYAGVLRAWSREGLLTALHRLGFAGVSETALGAQEVSGVLARWMQEEPRQKLFLSTACPAAVDYVLGYQPELAGYLTPFASPMIAHARLLRERFGKDIEVVFVGPCVAKKKEADALCGDISAALTFDELASWLDETGLEPARIKPDGGARFVPEASVDGGIYPVAGGMNDTLRLRGALPDLVLMTVSGLDYMKQTLGSIRAGELDLPVFMELLACEGGCVNGPGCGQAHSAAMGDLSVRRAVSLVRAADCAARVVNLSVRYERTAGGRRDAGDGDLEQALRRVGKYTGQDELNCGGCGYDTCRGFAAALLDGRAEPSMCLSYLRKQAQKKANALLRCMPSGVVIVDADMRIVECNENFAELFGEDAVLSYQARPGLEGVRLEKMVPFTDIFREVLESGEEYRNDMMRVGSSLMRVTVFSIVARQLGANIKTNLRQRRFRLPPVSEMPGVDLVTEGILTLTGALRRLTGEESYAGGDAADQLINLLRDSDIIDFIVGTRINEAHQDPRLPVDLEIRRNLVRELAHTLEKKYLKQVTIQLI